VAVDSYPRDAWVRVGLLLAARRSQLDPRYRIRKVFAAEVGIRETMLADVENAKRPNTFPPATIAAFETAYQLRHGSFEEALAGGELTPAQDAPRSLTAVESPPVPDYPEDVGDDPFLRRIWDDPFAPEDEKLAAIYGVKAHRATEARKLRREQAKGKQDATKRA
jgi:hypothetical protein